MLSQSHPVSRRKFLQHAGLVSAVVAGASLTALAAEKPYPVAAFEKALQHLPPEQMADMLAELGFMGVATPVRPKGRVLPERVAEDLPKLVEVLAKRKLEVTELTTNINDASDPLAQKVLQTAAKLGLKRYRMGPWKYDLKQPILEQVEAKKPVVRDLAALNKELGLTAVYQVHSGANYFGAAIWDIYQLFKDYDPKQLAIAFDIRHATVEGGTTWELNFNLIKSHLGLVYAKDFEWQGKKAQNVPLGEGMVNPRFYQMVKASGYDKPVLLHVEYPLDEDAKTLREAYRKDLAILRGYMEGKA
jgi:sugar phosphate isomerase/epimerase